MARVREDRLVESLRTNMRVRRDGSMVRSDTALAENPCLAPSTHIRGESYSCL